MSDFIFSEPRGKKAIQDDRPLKERNQVRRMKSHNSPQSLKRKGVIRGLPECWAKFFPFFLGAHSSLSLFLSSSYSLCLTFSLFEFVYLNADVCVGVLCVVFWVAVLCAGLSTGISLCVGVLCVGLFLRHCLFFAV